MAKKKKTNILRARVTPELKKRFVALYESRESTEAQMLRDAVVEYLINHEKKTAPIKKLDDL